MSEAEVPEAVSSVGGWLDDRLHGAAYMNKLMRKAFPDHWSFMFGEIALWSFVILLLTGTFLALFFVPSMTETVYHGSYTKLDGIQMSQAYASTLRISFDVRGGLLIRQIHHWAADMFVASMCVHMMRNFFTGAYRKPRELTWLIGVSILGLTLLEGLFGYSLPDDQLSGAGLRIFEGVVQGVPIVGTYAAWFLFDGAYPGTQIIPRMYIVHVLLLPGLLLALITAHTLIVVHQKHTQYPAKGHTEKNVVGHPFYPYFIVKGTSWFFFIFAALALLATFAQINPIWLYGPYNPVAISSASQPDWYLGMLEGALRMMPAWETNFLGHTISWSVWIPALVPLGLILGGAAIWPWFEAWVIGDKAQHNILDRPRNVPMRTGIGVAVIVFYGVLWAEGANDVIADRFQIPLYTVTWIARVLVFAGPLAGFFVTRHICLLMQHRDREQLEHGVETGIIRQTPGGAFIEVTRPVTAEERAVIEARNPAVAGEMEAPAPRASVVRAPGSGTMRGALHRRTRRAFFDSFPLPAGDGRNGRNGHNGQSGNGHANDVNVPEGTGQANPVEAGADSPPALPPGSGEREDDW